jgi:hypothetical protein
MTKAVFERSNLPFSAISEDTSGTAAWPPCLLEICRAFALTARQRQPPQSLVTKAE